MKSLGPILFCLLLLHFQCKSQQAPSFHHQYLNNYLFNPAAAGENGITRLYLVYRNQWAGIDGAPETFLLALDGRLEQEKLGIGFSVCNDVSNVIGRLNSAISASYTVDLSSKQEFAFGMSLMAIQNRIHFDKIIADELVDPELIGRSIHRTIADCNLGFRYRWNRFDLNLIADQVFQSEVRYETFHRLNNLYYKFVRHYVASVEYEFDIADGFTWAPQVLAHSTQGIPPKITAASVITYKNRLWMGSSYRRRNGIGISFGIELEDRLVLSYGHEIPLSTLHDLNVSTHEIVVGISLSEAIKQGKKLKPGKKEVRKRSIQGENTIQYEKIDLLEQVYENQLKKIEKFQEVIFEQTNEIEILKKEYKGIKSEIDSLKRRSHNPTDKISHSKDSDYYLIVGAFRKFENARIYQKVLKRDGGLDSQITQNNNKTWYLIYTEELEDLTDLEEKISILENGAAHHLILGNPWVFIKKK